MAMMRRQKNAAEALKVRSGQLDDFFNYNHIEIIEFFRQMERREEQLQRSDMTGVWSLKGQGANSKGEVNATRAGYLASLDLIWEGIERDLNSFGQGGCARDRRIGWSGYFKLSN